jgi:hypothetical protein
MRFHDWRTRLDLIWSVTFTVSVRCALNDNDMLLYELNRRSLFYFPFIFLSFPCLSSLLFYFFYSSLKINNIYCCFSIVRYSVMIGHTHSRWIRTSYSSITYEINRNYTNLLWGMVKYCGEWSSGHRKKFKKKWCASRLPLYCIQVVSLHSFTLFFCLNCCFHSFEHSN